MGDAQLEWPEDVSTQALFLRRLLTWARSSRAMAGARASRISLYMSVCHSPSSQQQAETCAKGSGGRSRGRQDLPEHLQPHASPCAQAQAGACA